MKIKTSELTGAALDWAVAKCDRLDPLYLRGFDFEPTWRNGHRKRYSTDWAHGGPIIDTFKPQFIQSFSEGQVTVQKIDDEGYNFVQHGPTLLIAAMRCFVASKLGDEVDVPEELLT